MEQLVLIDGNSLINRAFFAIPHLNDKDGRPTNAVYGFVNILCKIITDLRPSHLAVAFDLKGPTFRNELYAPYKANRKGMPDDLASQLPILKDLLKTMKINILEKQGIEADDIIGIISKRFCTQTIIVTGDRDVLQLVDDSTKIWLTKKGVTEIVEVTEQNIKELFGVSAAQVIDYKAICGDASDNIPGVRGIGEKGALSLIEQYGDLNNIYKNIDDIKGSLRDKLIAGKDSAHISKELATILTDADIKCTLNDCKLRYPFGRDVFEKIRDLEFRTLLKRIEFDMKGGADGTDDDGAGGSDSVKKIQAEKITITDAAALGKVVEGLKSASVLALHIDGDIHLAAEQGREYIIKISDNFFDGSLTATDALNALIPLISGDIPKVVYDNKAFRYSLKPFNIPLGKVGGDISIAVYVSDNSLGLNSLEVLCERFDLDKTCAAAALLYLNEVYVKRIERDNQTRLYYDIELPLSNILYETEQTGFKVDTKILNELSAKFELRLKELTDGIYLLAGGEFNINSTKQLGQVLFERLKLPTRRKTKTGFSTDNDVLEDLYGRHEIIEYIINYRQIAKLSSTYLEGLKPHIDGGGRVHTVFKQTLTSTGRLSSTEPNLQNIPIRLKEGRELRKMFVASSDKNVLIAADYSQIELRLLAHFSGDKELVKAYQNNVDIHLLTASQVFNMPLNMVTPSMRRSAKAVNFGIIYGISDFGLAKNLGITPKRAKEYIEKYFATYQSVKQYMTQSVTDAREKGYVTTILNRRRAIPEIYSNNHNIRGFGERAAMNMPLQGSAADIIKIAMIRVYDRFKTENIKSKIILQVHDELIVDALITERDAITKILKEEMEGAYTLSVPLVADINSGYNWFEA
jgi:DNA polymerase-1